MIFKRTSIEYRGSHLVVPDSVFRRTFATWFAKDWVHQRFSDRGRSLW